MTKELMKKYQEGNFMEIADLISDDSGEYFFNNNKVNKEGWLKAANGHHDLFDNIQNDSEGLILHLLDTMMVLFGPWHGFSGQGKVNIPVMK